MLTFNFNWFSIVDILAIIANAIMAVAYLILGLYVRSMDRNSSTTAQSLRALNPLAHHRLQFLVALICFFGAGVSFLYFLEDNQVPSGQPSINYIHHIPIYTFQLKLGYSFAVILLTAVVHFTLLCIKSASTSDLNPEASISTECNKRVQTQKPRLFSRIPVSLYYMIAIAIAFSQFIPGMITVPQQPNYPKSDFLHTAPWTPQFSWWLGLFSFGWLAALSYALFALFVKRSRLALPRGLRIAIILWLGSGVFDIGFVSFTGLCPPGAGPSSLFFSSLILTISLARDLKRVNTIMSQTAPYANPNLIACLLSIPVDRVNNDFDPNVKWITAVFTELTGFTSLSSDIQGNFCDLLTQIRQRFSHAARRHGCNTCRFTRDGMVFLWGAPDNSSASVNASNAVACSVDLENQLQIFQSEFLQKINDTSIQNLGVRAGVSTSAVSSDKVGQHDYSAFGSAVNVATSLEQSNKFSATRVLVSKSSLELLASTPNPHPILFRNVGLFKIKGAEDPIEAFEPSLATENPDLQRKQIQAYEKIADLYRKFDFNGCLNAIDAAVNNALIPKDDPRLQIYRRNCLLALSGIYPNTNCLNDSSLPS